jgi:hypothetical protein
VTTEALVVLPAWRAFERAVATLLQALDPAATVRHNAYTDDLDTGRKRQRDVWIETHCSAACSF